MKMTSETIAELRAAVQVGDESLEARRTARAAAIRKRLDAASGDSWCPVDLRHQQGGQIRIFARRGPSGILANVLRSGPNPTADSELIGNAPQDIAWLLAELDRVRDERNLLLAGADDATRLAYYSHRAEAEAHQAETRDRS